MSYWCVTDKSQQWKLTGLEAHCQRAKNKTRHIEETEQKEFDSFIHLHHFHTPKSLITHTGQTVSSVEYMFQWQRRPEHRVWKCTILPAVKSSWLSYSCCPSLLTTVCEDLSLLHSWTQLVAFGISTCLVKMKQQLALVWELSALVSCNWWM